MTAIRTLEFEDEFIEISLHALPVRFRSGEGDLLSCYFGCFKNFGRRQTYFEICVRIRETDDARRFFCNESSELHFLIIHRAQSHVGNRISHFQGGGNGSACASAVPSSEILGIFLIISGVLAEQLRREYIHLFDYRRLRKKLLPFCH
jgi:hypothetical protein